MKKENKKTELTFPKTLILPIKSFLERELVILKRRKKQLKTEDPFLNESRTTENSVEDDLDEQIGHFDTEVKTKFLGRQIIQFRKALTRIKIGKYGICEKCGKMIDTDRLAARPEATTCIKCSRDNE